MFIDSYTSKSILNDILNNRKIDYKKYKISKYKKKINKIIKDYKTISKKKNPSKYRNYFFWELMKRKYKISELQINDRNQKKKSNYVNIDFSIFSKILGYNPSLLSILLFENEFKLLIRYNNFFKEIQDTCEIENINPRTKLNIIKKISKKEIQIITPLCPDYEHVSLGLGLYKYTFNKLNDGLGLIGKRASKIIDNFQKILDKYDFKYKHYLYYGDFEAYSNEIKKRLKINEKQFIQKLEISAMKMRKKINENTEVKLLVKDLSKKSSWQKKCYENFFLIYKKFNNDVKFKSLINNIALSRKELYSSWFPNIFEKDFCKLVMSQGAEYATMGDIFEKKFTNPMVLGFDHPKMAIFYTLNTDIPVIYGKPKYV